jgi:hypothetical protein
MLWACQKGTRVIDKKTLEQYIEHLYKVEKRAREIARIVCVVQEYYDEHTFDKEVLVQIVYGGNTTVTIELIDDNDEPFGINVPAEYFWMTSDKIIEAETKTKLEKLAKKLQQKEEAERILREVEENKERRLLEELKRKYENV